MPGFGGRYAPGAAMRDEMLLLALGGTNAVMVSPDIS